MSSHYEILHESCNMSNKFTFKMDGFILPKNILPINYNLTIKAFYSSNLQPDENFFDSSFKIKFELTSPTNMIIFHADPSLKIIGQISLLNLATGESSKIINSRYLPNQLYQIVLDKNIPSQEYLMTISFKNDYGSESNLVGFHKINYFENGITKIMLSTKFQPADARRPFPCFDEPSLKATFDLTLEHPTDSIALGNWPEIPSEFHNIATKSFIEKWLYQKNFPEIKVKLNYTQAQPSVNFEQKVFLFDQQKEGKQNNDEWIVYLKCKVGGDTREFKYFLDKKQGIFELDRNFSWIKCNSDFRGYYLVNYEERNLDILNQILAYNYSAFSTEDRTEIVFETYFQALKGDKSYNKIKNITKLVTTNENTYITWNALLWNLKKLKTLTEFRPSFKELSDYFIPLLTNKYSFDELWNDSDIHSVKQIKSEILGVLCEMESEKCILKAKELFDLIPSEYFRNPEPNSKLNELSQNQRAIVYKYTIKNSDKNENWYKLLNLYFNSVSPSERENALNGLTSSTKIWQLETLYNEAFKQESKIRAEDFFYIMTLIGKNVQGRDFFWRKFRSEFFKIGNK
ncbi:unnamed protein product [Brachionus calyciflorus]|uniref:Aminopeptidase N n=1 Tax=Brachionus calyciflorus TaxID=104777 RepID=A0A814EN95_9BILA|nr:unnamed protein product [Brachionus calyciflorus]